MEHLFPNLLLLLTLIACQNNTETVQEENMEEKPMEWLTYEGAKDKKIVLVSGDEEYRSEEALPQLAKILNTHHGFNCQVLFTQHPDTPGIVDPNYSYNISGLEALEDADLMILFTRFRALPNEQMQYFQNYLSKGKPIIGIRTATHAFHFKDTTHQWKHWGNYNKEEGSTWDGGFGRLVLGEKWHTHHGHHKHQSTRGLIAENASDHPITNGIKDSDIWGSTDVYGVRLPLPNNAQHLILGQVIDRAGEYDENDLFYGMRDTDDIVAKVNPATKTPYNPNDPMMPIAWIKDYQLPDGEQGKAFTSTIGASADLLNEGVRRLLVNATYHLLDLEVPEKAKVDLVGEYEPSQFNFHDDTYWREKRILIEDLK
ncbi:MAG: ThuA domain-containing protein [Bacteroidota bacterium]